MQLIKHIGIPGLVFIVVVCHALNCIYLLPGRPSECVFFLEAVNSGPPATGAYILDYLEDNENVTSLSDTRLFRVRGEGLEGRNVTLAVSGVQLAGDLTVKPDTHCTDYIVIKAFHNPGNPLPPPETLTIGGETVRLFYFRPPYFGEVVAEVDSGEYSDNAFLGGIANIKDPEVDGAFRMAHCALFKTTTPVMEIDFPVDAENGKFSVVLDDGDD
ncbi:MAG: hypothetical protein ABIH04_06080, partial [Planctomycetota bacterium]